MDDLEAIPAMAFNLGGVACLWTWLLSRILKAQVKIFVLLGHLEKIKIRLLKKPIQHDKMT
ncbi:MAG: hypothetical protein HUJ51_06545 [Eggerthellaceae bacterium]|nr:hypothetical protein [Eggerthellaceae bacterium]